MLNVVPHIFSPLNFCVRTLVFSIIEENRIDCARAHRYRREVYRSNTGEREIHQCREQAIRQSC